MKVVKCPMKYAVGHVKNLNKYTALVKHYIVNITAVFLTQMRIFQ